MSGFGRTAVGREQSAVVAFEAQEGGRSRCGGSTALLGVLEKSHFRLPSPTSHASPDQPLKQGGFAYMVHMLFVEMTSQPCDTTPLLGGHASIQRHELAV